MNRSWLNLIIDAVTTVVALGLVWSGLLLHYVLPPGSGREGLGLWGLDRHAWGDLHFWLSLTTLVLVAVHVALHWTWVCTMVGRVFVGSAGAPHRSRRNAAGLLSVIGLLVLIGGGLWIADANVITSDEFREHERRNRLATERGAGRTQTGETAAGAAVEEDLRPSLVAVAEDLRPSPVAVAERHTEPDGHTDLLRGSMTIGAAAKILAVTPQNLIDELDLPATTDPDQRLGRTLRSHGRTMSEARDLLRSLDPEDRE